ncbi:MAG TPA: DMT family transporter [Ktedonobacteraceae bacterium]|jgi:drug/metabolite transporter (DMT)-like permease|nr:DMT family transporter [Ktedonobacteraceae bacterium]
MHLRGIGYAIIASFMFGLGAVLAKLVGSEIDAALVAFLDLAVGGLLLTLCLAVTSTPFIRQIRRLRHGDWINVFLLACPGTSLPLLLIVAGFARTSALEGGFLLQLNGVAALIFALALLGERIRLKQSLGILLLLVGSALVVLKGTTGGDAGSGIVGDLMIVGGTIAIGFAYIPAKRLTSRIDTLPLTAIRLFVGAATILPVLGSEFLVGAHSFFWQPTLVTFWITLPVYILTNFCLGYLSQQEGLKLIKAWEVATITQTVPLFSTAFAILLLHDSMTPIQAIGGLIAIAGGIVVSLNNEAPTPVVLAEKEQLQEVPGEDRY